MQSFQSFLALYNFVKEAGIIKQFSQRVYTTVHLGLERNYLAVISSYSFSRI